MSFQPQIPLHKVDNIAVGHGHELPTQGQVLVQGRILFDRTAFVGHSFKDEDQDLVDFVKAFLAELSVKSITGESAVAGSVSQKVKDRIAQAELFVGILTRLEETAPGRWNTSEWLLQERTHAAALGKRIVLLKEKGVELQGGLHGDHEYIEFDRNKMHARPLS